LKPFWSLIRGTVLFNRFFLNDGCGGRHRQSPKLRFVVKRRLKFKALSFNPRYRREGDL
jgi:hypothetical protein